MLIQKIYARTGRNFESGRRKEIEVIGLGPNSGKTIEVLLTYIEAVLCRSTLSLHFIFIGLYLMP